MGSKHSKSAARAEVAPILPRKWLELEQLHLRFQQEAHRRARSDPQSQFFLSFPVFQTILAPICAAHDIDKTQLLAIFDVLDRRKRRKLAAIDFFCGLALVVEGKKSTKFECTCLLLIVSVVRDHCMRACLGGSKRKCADARTCSGVELRVVIVALLDNGGVKTLNKCELMMILMAAVRGLAMFKRSPDVREDVMKPLAKRTAPLSDLRARARRLRIDACITLRMNAQACSVKGAKCCGSMSLTKRWQTQRSSSS